MDYEFYMDIPAVRNISRRLTDIGEVLKSVSEALQRAIEMLDSIAFVGLVGTAAAARYLREIKPVIDRACQKALELSGEVNLAVDAYERGDQLGATKFYN